MTRALAAALLLAACACRSAPSAAPSPTPAPTSSATVLAGPVSFASPTGNVGCYVATVAVRCRVTAHTWHAPPPPSDCFGDYGSVAFLPARDAPAYFDCVTDDVPPPRRTLRYGESVTFGPFRCTSRTDGVRCEHTGTSHALFLSRERYAVG